MAGDHYLVKHFGSMINDRARTAALVGALRQALAPGDVVLDIGTGIGFFAFLACELGAAKVYAIEPNETIDLAREWARSLPGSDRIEWIQGLSTELTLPEPVDVVIGDLHGVLPFYNGCITSMIDARRRHLKPGGTIIPSIDRIRVVPAEAPGEFESVTAPWLRNDYQLDLRGFQRYVTNTWWRAQPEPIGREALLAQPATWSEIDYQRVESPNADATVDFEAVRQGTMHGYYVWFDGEAADGLTFSNAPWLPALVFSRAFFPLPEAVTVDHGDRVTARFSASLVGGRYVFRWTTNVGGADGQARIAFDQSTFYGQPIGAVALLKREADYVPTLGRDGEVDLFVLQALRDRERLGDIAAKLADRFPSRFSDTSVALPYVGRLSVQYA